MSYNEWLDIDVLEAYLNGKLDSKTMHQVEKISLEDPFVAEALAGLTESKKHKQSLSILQKQLQQRVAQKPIATKRWRITSQRLSIGAAAAVLFITVSLFFFMRENKRQQIAKNQPEKVDVTITPKVATTQVQPETQPVEKSGNVPSNAATKLAIDRALAEAKKTAIAKNKTPRIVKDVIIPGAVVTAAVADSPKPSTAAAKQAAPLKEEQIQIANNNTRPKGEALAVLKGKADGITVPSRMVQGRVIDKVTNMPLTSVAIMQAGSTAVSATTDVNGIFKIPVENDANDLTLKFSYLGFKSQEVKVDPKKITDIQLEQDDRQLSEVVVTNYGKASKRARVSEVFITATPVDGWEEYNKNIYNSISRDLPKIPKAVDVELAFVIKANGNPSNIKVAKSGGKVFDQEAIRLLKNGGKWTYASNGTNRGDLKIIFNK